MTCIRMVMRTHALSRMMMMMLVMMMVSGPSTAFNLDLTTARVLRGANNSLFGYAVTLWNEGRNNKRLVVGAPRGTNSTAANYTLPLGNVHICLAQEEGPYCSLHPTLPKLSDIDTSQEALYVGEGMATQGMGFGETVYTDYSGQNRLLVCAPRYPIYNDYYQSVQARGACYVLSKIDKHSLVVPFQDRWTFVGRLPNGTDVARVNRFDFTGFSLAGFSAAFITRQHWVVMGGPFAFHAQGVLVKGKWKDKGELVVNKDYYSYDYSNNGNMQGWAVVVAKFDSENEWVATSLPGANNKGKIIFSNKNLELKPKFNLTGSEVGAWFGYSLGSGHLNGDRNADLLVGSPLAHGTHKQHYDAGKLFIYYSPVSTDTHRPDPQVLVGMEPWGRFGTSVACVGDLNQDGYNDVAVGAPGATGRVYIYNGGDNGLHPEPTQILEASAFYGGPPGSFGFSVSGGLDMDNNGYPDLIIGAPLSDAAVFVRTKAVVELFGWIEFDPQVLNVETKSCTLPGEGGTVACMNLLVKLHYASINTAQNLQVEVAVRLDDTQRRLGFMVNGTSSGSISGNKANYTCELTVEEGTPTLTIPVYLKQGIYNVDLPATASVTVRQPTFVPPSGPPSSSPDVAPVFSAFTDTSFKAQVRLDCTDVTTCYSKPDIVLNVEGPAELVVGEGEVEVSVVVKVTQDKAYEAKLVVEWVPGGLEYLWVKDTTTHVPTCRTKTHPNARSLTCFLSNELDVGEQVPMTLVFSQSIITLLAVETPDLTFHFNVTSQSRDVNITDNTYDLVIKKTRQTDLFLNGLPIPEVVSARENESLSLEQVYNPDLRNKARLTDLGPYLAHRYTLVNHGPTPLFDVQVLVQVPSLADGQPILYLVEPLKTSDAARCDTPHLNPFNFTIDSENDEERDQEFIDLQDLPNSPDKYTDSKTTLASEDEPVMTSHSSVDQPVSPSHSTETSSSSDDQPLEYSLNPSLKNHLQRERREAALPSPSAQANSYSTPSSTSPASPSTSPTSPSSLSTTASTAPSYASTTPSYSSTTPSSPSTTAPSATTTQTSPTSISSVNPEREEEEEEDGTQSVITIDCDHMTCEEILCLVPSLAPGELVTLEVGGYLVVASIKYRYRHHLKKKQRSISLTSTATLLTEQLCVFINGEGIRGPHCAGSAQETDKLSGNHESIGTDEQTGADNVTGTDEVTDVENWETEDEGRNQSELINEGSNVNRSHRLKRQVPESVLSITNHSIQADNGGTMTTDIDSTTLKEDHSEIETTTDFYSTATQPGFQHNFDTVATTASPDFGNGNHDDKNTEATTEFDVIGNTTADYDSISIFEGDQNDNSTEATTDLDSTPTYDQDDNSTEPTMDLDSTPTYNHDDNSTEATTDPNMKGDIGEANSSGDSVPKNPIKGGPRSGAIMDRRRPEFSVTVATSITIIKSTETREANIWDVAPWKLFVAILVATMIIIIIIAILFKAGFFKRKNRISTEQRQELKRRQKRRSRAQSYHGAAYNAGGVIMVG